LSALGARFADASSPGWVTELRKNPPPNASTASATVPPPPGSKDSSEPTGAIITGMRSRLPRKLVLQSTVETSRSTRGRKAIWSSAWRLRRIVVSVSVAPTR
jgi:hypothetical protein